MDKDKIIVYLIAALMGAGGNFGFSLFSDPRPDPWTGTDDRDARIEERVWTELQLKLMKSEIMREFDRKAILYWEQYRGNKTPITEQDHRRDHTHGGDHPR